MQVIPSAFYIYNDDQYTYQKQDSETGNKICLNLGTGFNYLHHKPTHKSIQLLNQDFKKENTAVFRDQRDVLKMESKFIKTYKSSGGLFQLRKLLNINPILATKIHSKLLYKFNYDKQDSDTCNNSFEHVDPFLEAYMDYLRQQHSYNSNINVGTGHLNHERNELNYFVTVRAEKYAEVFDANTLKLDTYNCSSNDNEHSSQGQKNSFGFYRDFGEHYISESVHGLSICFRVSFDLSKTSQSEDRICDALLERIKYHGAVCANEIPNSSDLSSEFEEQVPHTILMQSNQDFNDEEFLSELDINEDFHSCSSRLEEERRSTFSNLTQLKSICQMMTIAKHLPDFAYHYDLINCRRLQTKSTKFPLLYYVIRPYNTLPQQDNNDSSENLTVSSSFNIFDVHFRSQIRKNIDSHMHLVSQIERHMCDKLIALMWQKKVLDFNDHCVTNNVSQELTKLNEVIQNHINSINYYFENVLLKFKPGNENFNEEFIGSSPMNPIPSLYSIFKPFPAAKDYLSKFIIQSHKINQQPQLAINSSKSDLNDDVDDSNVLLKNSLNEEMHQDSIQTLSPEKKFENTEHNVELNSDTFATNTIIDSDSENKHSNRGNEQISVSLSSPMKEFSKENKNYNNTNDNEEIEISEEKTLDDNAPICVQVVGSNGKRKYKTFYGHSLEKLMKAHCDQLNCDIDKFKQKHNGRDIGFEHSPKELSMKDSDQIFFIPVNFDPQENSSDSRAIVSSVSSNIDSNSINTDSISKHKAKLSNFIIVNVRLFFPRNFKNQIKADTLKFKVNYITKFQQIYSVLIEKFRPEFSGQIEGQKLLFRRKNNEEIIIDSNQSVQDLEDDIGEEVCNDGLYLEFGPNNSMTQHNGYNSIEKNSDTPLTLTYNSAPTSPTSSSIINNGNGIINSFSYSDVNEHNKDIVPFQHVNDSSEHSSQTRTPKKAVLHSSENDDSNNLATFLLAIENPNDEGQRIGFRVNNNTPIATLLSAYSNRLGINTDEIMFSHNNIEIFDGPGTVKDFGLNSESVIKAYPKNECYDSNTTETGKQSLSKENESMQPLATSPLNINVKALDGNMMRFKVLPDTPIDKIIQALKSRAQDSRPIKLLHNGYDLSPDISIGKAGIKNMDMLVACI